MVEYVIRFAQSDAEAELRGIFLESGMDLAGELQEHVVIRKQDEVIGGALVTQTSPDVYHLTVFAIKESARSRGIGSLLIRDLVREPWKYSLNASGVTGDRFTVTTMAKGQSVIFYRKNGFSPCEPAELADPYRGQCDACAERGDCNPLPMKYGGRPAAVVRRG